MGLYITNFLSGRSQCRWVKLWYKVKKHKRTFVSKKGVPCKHNISLPFKKFIFSHNKKERKMLGKLIAFETPRITKTKHLQFPWLEVWRQMSFSIYIAIKIYINQYWKKLKQYNKKIRKALKNKTFLIIRFIYKDIRHCVVTIRL